MNKQRPQITIPDDFPRFIVKNDDGDIGLAYNFTRDQILSEGVKIPYPHAYWHARFIQMVARKIGTRRYQRKKIIVSDICFQLANKNSATLYLRRKLETYSASVFYTLSC